MAALLVSPRLIDMILVFTVAEAIILLAWLRRASPVEARRWASAAPGTSGDVRAVGLLLLPGVCLMLAIRAALTGAAWPWVPAALAASLVAHLLDLRNRWRG